MYLHEDKTVVHLSDQGAMITGWWHDGVPVFMPQTMVERGGVMKLRGGMFEGVPNFGAPPMGFPDLPQHGLLRLMRHPHSRCPARFVGPNHAVYIYVHMGMLSFPWPFLVRVETRVHAVGFTRTIVLSRKRDWQWAPSWDNKDDMPYNVGFHPYFRTPKGVATVSPETTPIAVECGPLQHEGPYQLYDKTHVEIPGLGSVTIRADEGFDPRYNVFWLWREDDTHLCVEPSMMDPAKLGYMLGREQEVTVSARFEFRPETES